MDLGVLNSYLVSLGFKVDQPEFRKFEHALKEAKSSVDFTTKEIAKQFLGWQAAIVGAFVGVGAAVVGLGEKVSSQDQQYRLFGLRMMMTQQSAKELQIGLDALGATLEDVAWDPELHARFLQLKEDQDNLTKSLGVSFGGQMRALRDLHFEVSRLHVAMQYLAMAFVGAVFSKFGMTIEDVQKKLESLNAWVEKSLPGIASQLADDVMPVLRATWSMLLEVGEAAKQFAILFDNVVGLLSNDESIMGTTFSFEKLGSAVGHVVSWMSAFVHIMTQAEEVVIHLVNALSLSLHGHFTQAAEEIKGAIKELGIGSGAALGAAIGSMVQPGLGTAVGGIIGGALGGVNPFSPAGRGESDFQAQAPKMDTNQLKRDAYRLAVQAGSELGLDPKLIFEQWEHETGKFTNRGAQRLNNLGGIRIPGTQNYEQFSSLDEYEKRYVAVLKSGRYQKEGIGQARNEEEFGGALKRGGYYEDESANYVRGLKSHAGDYAEQSGKAPMPARETSQNPWEYDPRQAEKPAAASGVVVQGGINITITNPKSSDEAYKAARRGVEDELKKQTQRDLVQVGAG